MGKMVFPSFDRIFVILAGNQDRQKNQVWILAESDQSLWSYVPLHQNNSLSYTYTFKHEYLHLASLDQILCVASMGWGKGCIKFWDRLDQNCCHGDQKLPLTYNGENVFWFGVISVLRPFNTFRSFRARSVTLTTLFLGKPPRQFTST